MTVGLWWTENWLISANLNKFLGYPKGFWDILPFTPVSHCRPLDSGFQVDAIGACGIQHFFRQSKPPHGNSAPWWRESLGQDNGHCQAANTSSKEATKRSNRKLKGLMWSFQVLSQLDLLRIFIDIMYNCIPQTTRLTISTIPNLNQILTSTLKTHLNPQIHRGCEDQAKYP